MVFQDSKSGSINNELNTTVVRFLLNLQLNVEVI